MTKAVTGAGVMQQVERGRLSLDGDIAAILPQLGRVQVLEGFDADGQPRLRAPKRAITLRHLLTHNAGYAYDWWNGDITRYMELTATPGVLSCQNAALALPLIADPGEKWEYGISIDWAGKAVEAVSGQTLDKYLQESLLQPLGMTDTAFKIGDAQRRRLARIYSRTPEGLIPTDMEIPQNPQFHMGGGGLYSTVGDYLKFAQMILHGGTFNGAQVLRPETVATMFAQRHGGLGLQCDEDGCPVVQPRRRFRRWHAVGSELPDQPGAVADRPLRGQSGLGWPRQFVLLDRSDTEGRRRLCRAGAAVLR
jgi:methyl acetate hydrolase